MQIVKGTRYVLTIHDDNLMWMETMLTPITDLRVPNEVAIRLRARLAMDTDRTDHDAALLQAWDDGIAYWRKYGVTNQEQVGNAIASAGTS